jgi:hypothetical protein
MTSTLSPPPFATRRSTHRQTGVSTRADQARTRERQPPHTDREGRVLARYTDAWDCPRQIVAQRGSAASLLIVDRRFADRGDSRLVAHLAADEPEQNATLECERYLQDARCGRGRCRALTAEDFRAVPFAEEAEAEPSPASIGERGVLDEHGRRFRLASLQSGMSIPELRWRRDPDDRAGAASEPVSVREVIACLEAYEPVRTLTLEALTLHRGDPQLSTAVLRAELQRVLLSPIVLNRALRQAVREVIDRQGLSLSEVAIRCGRVKRDIRGNESGETSWLARRLGILPEGGRDEPTPWIHSDVLALIARRGLGVSPREVELQ